MHYVSSCIPSAGIESTLIPTRGLNHWCTLGWLMHASNIQSLIKREWFMKIVFHKSHECTTV